MPAAIVTKAEKMYDDIKALLDAGKRSYTIPELGEYDGLIVPTLMRMFEQEGWKVRLHNPVDLCECEYLEFSKRDEKKEDNEVPWAD